MKRIVSGIQSSGDITLGNYFGAILNLLELQQDPNNELFVFIADLHSITVDQEPASLRQSILKLAKLYLAAGLDPKRTHLFVQSDLLMHNQLAWILECNTYLGELERMTQYKDKKVKQTDGIRSGLLTYPALMAADILLYDADLVPVGIDQKQHLELTRNLAIRFNNKYGATFKVPEVYIPNVGSKIMSLTEPTKKMSKSAENKKSVIFLLDDINVSIKKIKSAVTDSIGVINLDYENQPGIYNLLSIYACLEGITLEEAHNTFKDSSYKVLKDTISTSLANFLTKLQANYNAISDSEVIAILKKGSTKASEIATLKLNEVKGKVGLGI